MPLPELDLPLLKERNKKQWRTMRGRRRKRKKVSSYLVLSQISHVMLLTLV